MWDRLITKIRLWLSWLDAAGYTSAPQWKPWRDF
jgi:hypothetical protein